ncbi:ABC transporter permease subunit [Streptomyces catenulae]|uniref:ABC transporter permease n=1 Tax=Streptomyces catenulae TaxID=66875 RepID=A0ABV2Z3Y2_9ACTN|nr:ABC transporter permease [Streptomyces catenulae]
MTTDIRAESRPRSEGHTPDMSDTATGRTSGGLLHGLPWLVWRRHRAALTGGIIVTVLASAFFVYEHFAVVDLVQQYGSQPGERASTKFGNDFGRIFRVGAGLLTFLPAIIGLFLGAPLIAGEQEHGTIRLVTTQSVSRARWIVTTLALPLGVVTLCTTALSLSYWWMWVPARSLAFTGDWLNGGPFDITGPMLPAKSLFFAVCGIALGMLLKRLLTSMVATVVFMAAFSIVWDRVPAHLAALRHAFAPLEHEVLIASDAINMDSWVATADGTFYGIGTCLESTEGATDACRAKMGITQSVTDYFGFDQMVGMQWRGSAILFALTALILGFVAWRAHRRPL